MSHRRREIIDYIGVLLGLFGVLLLWHHAAPTAVAGGLALLGAAFFALVTTRLNRDK